MLEEELKTLLAAAAAGDENAFAQLSERYSPLIQSMSARFAPSFGNSEDAASVGVQDLEQEARLALYRAALTYDRTQKNVSFGLYAKICIRNSFVSALRKSASRARAGKRADSLPAVQAEDPFRIASAEDESGRLQSRINQVLSPYEKKIFEQYISGRSVKCISLSVGKSEKSVHNAVYRIRVKIKGLLEN